MQFIQVLKYKHFIIYLGKKIGYYFKKYYLLKKAVQFRMYLRVIFQ